MAPVPMRTVALAPLMTIPGTHRLLGCGVGRDGDPWWAQEDDGRVGVVRARPGGVFHVQTAMDASPVVVVGLLGRDRLVVVTPDRVVLFDEAGATMKQVAVTGVRTASVNHDVVVWAAPGAMRVDSQGDTRPADGRPGVLVDDGHELTRGEGLNWTLAVIGKRRTHDVCHFRVELAGGRLPDFDAWCGPWWVGVAGRDVFRFHVADLAVLT